METTNRGSTLEMEKAERVIHLHSLSEKRKESDAHKHTCKRHEPMRGRH